MPNLPLFLVILLLRLAGRTRKFRSAEDLHREVAKERRVHNPVPPADIARRFAVTHREIHGRSVYTLAPRGASSGVYVFYLHGGAYVSGITPFHWRFLARLIEDTGCTVTAPLYPLAPEASHRDAHPFALEAYRQLAAQAPPDKLILMGDSSGGGFALALAQTLLEQGLPQPRNIVLISPWLDITAKNPDIAKVQPHDPWLRVPGALEAGRLWAAGADPNDPKLSPINGPLKGLGHLTLFIGTRDILLPDCRKLRDRAKAEGVPLCYVEAPGMIHVWPILPVREANAAIRQIAGIVKGNCD